MASLQFSSLIVQLFALYSTSKLPPKSSQSGCKFKISKLLPLPCVFARGMYHVESHSPQACAIPSAFSKAALTLSLEHYFLCWKGHSPAQPWLLSKISAHRLGQLCMYCLNSQWSSSQNGMYYHQNVKRWEWRTDLYMGEHREWGPYSCRAALPSKILPVNIVSVRQTDTAHAFLCHVLMLCYSQKIPHRGIRRVSHCLYIWYLEEIKAGLKEIKAVSTHTHTHKLVN